MMNNNLFNEISSTIVRDINPEKIILFGSYARNEQTPDSDLDIMIILKNDSMQMHSKIKAISSIRKSLMNINVPKDILVFFETEIDEWKNSKNHIISRALNDGLCIYERSKACS